MATFEKTDEDYDDVFARAMAGVYDPGNKDSEKIHKDLIDTKARVLAMFAKPPTDEYGEKTGPALTSGGLRVLWKVKTTNLEHRSKYNVDAEFLIDKEAWDAWTEDERYAAVDEMLYSLEVQRDKDNYIKSDDIGHPVMKIRKPDIVVKTYTAMIRRHKEESEGYKAIQIHAHFREQMLMEWGTKEDEPSIKMMDRPDAASRKEPATPKKKPDPKPAPERAAAKTKPPKKKAKADARP